MISSAARTRPAPGCPDPPRPGATAQPGAGLPADLRAAVRADLRAGHRDDLCAAALAAVARGWPVFPCHPGGKEAAVKDWENAATLDPDWVRYEWRRRPMFNPAIATGRAGLVVLDLDVAAPGQPHPDGRDVPARGWTGWHALRELAHAAGRRVPRTATVLTPSGGAHCYFTAPPGAELRNTGSKIGWKLDTRACGGYVLAAGAQLNPDPNAGPGARAGAAAPSASPRYCWWPRGGREVIALPGWLLELLTAADAGHRVHATGGAVGQVAQVQLAVPGHTQRYLAAAVRAELDRVTRAVEGTRNNQLFIAAAHLGELVAGGALGADDVRAQLLDVAAEHVRAGAYDQRQAEQTISSGLRAGARHPRTVTGAAPTGPAPTVPPATAPGDPLDPIDVRDAA